MKKSARPEKDVRILDCTLRDGSYVNNFQFSASDTKLICMALDSAGVTHIEIGHGLGLGAYRKGGSLSSAATDEEYLQAAAEGVKKSNFGMFCIPGFAEVSDIDLAHSYGMDFIRIGTNVHEIEKSEPFIERAKKHGMMVCANYMKSYTLPPQKLAEKAVLSGKYGADYIYIVDSAGGMLPSELSTYIKALKEKVSVGLGYHGHNNLGLAVANSLLASDLGVHFIDTSLQGLGRGGGNAPTEQMLLVMERAGYKHKIDMFKILDIGFDIISPLLVQTGLNPIDLVSGFALFHSSYIPVIKKYSNKYCVDPRALIIELCKTDQVNADPALVERIASKLKRKSKAVFFSKYHLERYFVNEQGQ
ncbi:MAG: 4-hydroxy-2-oxovalerate aldolase [Lentisphaerae bacterium]|nr:4-hydroxy-2-oxovalerate aldolase [Lentisphaerota bacterium]